MKAIYDKKFKIINSSDSRSRLRTINIDDLEYLRIIKNNNRKSFFYNKEISRNDQFYWFEKYMKSPFEYLFIFEEKIDLEFKRVGSLGFRIKDGECDLYNIIRGPIPVKSITRMSDGLSMLIHHIHRNFPLMITAKVIHGNEALKWYLKNKFTIESEGDCFSRIIFTDN